MSDAVLVIGGGIAGIQCALDLANAGTKVVLVEREPAIGGKMAALDKNFPTLDCSICIEAPKMSDVTHHPNIELLTLSEVTRVEGAAGNFTVAIRQEPRFVTDECTRCGECVPVCPQILSNEFDVGMGARKAIYAPFEQAEPGAYVVDVDHCLNKPPNYLPCSRCLDACGPACIDFDMRQQAHTRKVGAIIVATGFELLHPELLPEYGYGKHPDILSSMEFERLLQASGPSSGNIIKPSDGKEPHSILFVLCVGSRDQRFCRYCSRICCMYSIKEAVQAIDHGIKNITVLYMDIRAYGKGFDDFYLRTREEGVQFIRGRPAEIEPNGHSIKARFENTDTATVEELEFDMVVLASAVVPSGGTKDLAGILGIELDEDGFFKSTQHGGDMIATTRPGIFTAGGSTGPKDIPDSVTEASGAAASAMTLVTQKTWPKESPVQPIDTTGEPRIGVFLCDCGLNVAGTINVPEVVTYTQTLGAVTHAEEMRFACAGNTQEQIAATIKEKRLNRVVVAACSPKTHGTTFQRVCAKAGLNPYLFDMANIRNQGSWVHKKEPVAATEKAKDLVKMSVKKAFHLEPLKTMEFPVVQRALVVGGGIAGMTAAAALAKQGFEAHLVERQLELGGMLRHIDEIAPSGIKTKDLLMAKESEVKEAGVNVHLKTTIENVSGFVGNFNVHLSDGTTLDVGSIVLATGAEAYKPTSFNYGQDKSVVSSLDLESILPKVEADEVTIVACVGSRTGDMGCSRFCCQTMINQALRLRKMGKKVRVLYRDLRTFTRYGEETYYEASKSGVQFFQYSQDQAPENALQFERQQVTFRDELTGGEVSIPTDLLVLNVGLRPPKDESEGIAQQLKVSRDQAGFLLETHPKLGPVEAAAAGVFLAGTAQGPKDVRESVAQGLAAAAKAAAILSRTVIEREPLSAIIDYDKCIICMRCAPVCPYTAIRGKLKENIELYSAMCMGCGACASECTVDAVTMPGFTDEQIISQIDAATEANPEEKVLVFACNWCSYAGADQAGIAKIQYPPSSRVIRTMCSARVSQKFIFRAFERGIGAVLVTGCHIGDCHYINANTHTQKRVQRWQKTLQARGIDPRRLQLWWVSAAEGRRFAEKVNEMDMLIKELRVQGAILKPVLSRVQAR